jgi:hypothetical protein
MTRAHAKLLEQKVNSLLADFDIFINESFILPKSLLLFMIRFEVEDSMAHGEEMHKDHCGLSSSSRCMREDREEGATPLNMKDN